MKRIICTVSNDLTYDQRMIRICTTLAENGYDVLLAGRELPDSQPFAKQLFSQKRFKLRFNHGKLFYLELNLRLFFFLLFAKHDLVYAVDLDTLMAGRMATWLRGKICVYDAHEYFTEVPELAGRSFSKKIWETVARIFIPSVKYAITVGECLAEVFEQRYGVHFTVIRNMPLVQNYEKQTGESGPFIVIYQGALNDGRGLEESILAMKLLENAELWICGEGDLSAQLRELMAENGLQQKVKFLGKLPPAELSRLTIQADLGLNLLKNKGLNYYYSLANKAFDYVQAGLPSLGMAFPEYLQLNEKHGVFELLDELTPTCIAEAVTRFRSDHKHYETMAANCRAAASTLNWQEESKQLLDFFKKIDWQKS